MVSEHEWFNFKQWLLRSRRSDRLNKLYQKPNVSLTKSMSSCNWECWYPQKNLPLSIHTKDLNWIVLWSWFMTVHSEMSNFYQIFCSCIDTVRNNKFSLDICNILRHLAESQHFHVNSILNEKKKITNLHSENDKQISMLILKYDLSYIAIKDQFFIFLINNKAPKSTPCLTPLSLCVLTVRTSSW